MKWDLQLQLVAAHDGHWILLLPLSELLLTFSKQRSCNSFSFTRLLTLLPFIFWQKVYLPDITPMTCLICVPKLPWSRTKLCKSPLFKQIFSRCVILAHFLSLSLHTISPPSFPSSPISLPIPFKNSTRSRSENAAAAYLLKYLYFSFMLYRLSQLCSLTQSEKDIELYVLFNLNKHAKSLRHLGETNRTSRLEDGTKRTCWLFLFKI